MPSYIVDRRHVALAAVVALHLAALWLMQHNLAGSRVGREVARLPSLVVQLIAPSPAIEPRAASKAPTRAATARTGRGTAVEATRSDAAPEAAPAADTAAHVDVAAPAAITQPVEVPPLRLGLPGRPTPGQAQRNPALDDPRATTSTTSASDRFAKTLGTDNTQREERLGDGRLKIRRGNDCVLLAPSRNAEIDPMDDRSKRLPAAAGNC